MFKQRFQPQILLASLFNYMSGRLQLSSKSGLCFYRPIEFSACFDPAISQFNFSVQNKQSTHSPLKPIPAWVMHSPGTERWINVFLLFLILNCYSLEVLKHIPWCLEGGTDHGIVCSIKQAPEFMASSDLNALPAVLCAGGRLQLQISFQAEFCPCFLFYQLFLKSWAKSPTATSHSLCKITWGLTCRNIQKQMCVGGRNQTSLT